MSDIAIQCIKKELDEAYGMAIDNLGHAVHDMQFLHRVLQQARVGNHMEGPAICHTHHLGIVDSCRSRISILERLLEEIDFEQNNTSGTTPLNLWIKDHPH